MKLISVNQFSSKVDRIELPSLLLPSSKYIIKASNKHISMSYGHCIVLKNQNRDTVQIISVQDKAAVKE